MAKSFESSSLYNPSVTPGTQGLYQLMQSEPNEEAVLERFKDRVNSMSSTNPYVGVMVNPRQCEVDQATTTLDEVMENIAVKPNIPPVVETTLEDARNKLDEYREHTERLISNFPTISSIVQQEIAKATKTGNPCLAFGDMMGSVLQQGQDIMGEILGAIADVAANIDDVQELIENAIPKLEASIAKAITQKEEEVTRLAEAMMNVSRMSLAQLLAFQNDDPCLSQIISSVVTPEANQILNSLDQTEDL